MIRRFITGGVLCLTFMLALGFPQTLSPLARNAAVAASFTPQNEFPPMPAGAGSNLIDPTFGTGGRVTTAVSPGADTAFAVAIQGDGKIVAAGSTMDYPLSDFALVRYNTDGALDTTFGTGGVVRTDFNGGNDALAAIVIQPDGKIVAAGEASTPPSTNPHFALARYNANGALDTTFGSGGKVVVNASLTRDHISALALQSDGRIVAAGFADNPSLPASDAGDFAVARFTAGGALDTTFGVAGITTVDFIGKNDFANTLLIQPDGTILAAGAMTSPYLQKIALVRLTAAGMLDPGFGTGGKVVATFQGTSDRANALLRQADGRFIVGGNSYASRYYGLARFNPDGTYDTTFANGGKRWDYLVGSYKDLRALAFGPDGMIMAIGWALNVSTGYDLLIARYTSNGLLDTGFGAQGVASIDFGYTSEQAYALALQRDYKLVLAGGSATQSSRDFLVARFYYNAAPMSGDFSVACSPATLTVYPGASGTANVTLTPVSNFNGQVSLSWMGAPDLVYGGFTPKDVWVGPGGATSLLSITVSPFLTPGTYPFSLVATSGTLTHTIPFQLIVPAPPPPVCTYAISKNEAWFSYPGGTGTVNVMSAAGCQWAAVSNAGWLQVIGGASGAGNGIVNYRVLENTGSSQRIGTFMIAGQTLTVTQEGNPGPCQVTLVPSSQVFSAAAATSSLGVFAGPGCDWTAITNVSWIMLTTTSGTGNGTVSYKVSANTTGKLRTGNIIVGNASAIIKQDYR